GSLMWVSHYRGVIESTASDGDATGVVHIDGPASDLFLISATSGRSTWFFQIDGGGNFVAGTAYQITDFVVQRLRETATQGIFAPGALGPDPWTARPYIVCIDPKSGYPRWERSYSTPLPPPLPVLTGPVWYDIAEGVDCLMAIANSMESIDPHTGYIVRLE